MNNGRPQRAISFARRFPGNSFKSSAQRDNRIQEKFGHAVKKRGIKKAGF
jgi:hypothetical protein